MVENRFTNNYQSNIKDVGEHKNPRPFYIRGSDENNIFARQPFTSNVLVLLVDFTV